MAEMIRSGDVFYNLVKPRIIRDEKLRKKMKQHTKDQFFFGSFYEATDFAAECMLEKMSINKDFNVLNYGNKRKKR